MIERLYYLAALFAIAGAVRGNPCAWGLLGAAAASAFLEWRGVPFDMATWLLIDIAAVSLIAAIPRALTVKDTVVVLLFLPAWALYLSDSQWAIDLTTAICTAQFMLVTPWAWLLERSRAFWRWTVDPPDEFYRVAHA
jgi:hypothetical protein